MSGAGAARGSSASRASLLAPAGAPVAETVWLGDLGGGLLGLVMRIPVGRGVPLLVDAVHQG